jgi:hypothetical protein
VRSLCRFCFGCMWVYVDRRGRREKKGEGGGGGDAPLRKSPKHFVHTKVKRKMSAPLHRLLSFFFFCILCCCWLSVFSRRGRTTALIRCLCHSVPIPLSLSVHTSTPIPPQCPPAIVHKALTSPTSLSNYYPTPRHPAPLHLPSLLPPRRPNRGRAGGVEGALGLGVLLETRHHHREPQQALVRGVRHQLRVQRVVRRPVMRVCVGGDSQ